MCKLVTCFGIVNPGSYRLLPTMQFGVCAVPPRTFGMSNDLSRTLEVYQKVLHVLDCILKGPFHTVVP